MTTPLFLLRCVELGISVRDLELLTIGLILDMWTEKDNDGIEYDRITTAVAYKRSTESSYTTTSVTFSSGTAFIFGGGNMSTDYSYDIRYTLTDAFGSIIVVDSLSTASVLMDFKAGGTGIGVGKVAETDNLLDVGMNAKFRGTVSGKVASLDGYDSVIASDFNDYKEVGIYIVSSDEEMQNIANRPCDNAGTLYVKNSFNDGKSTTSTWVYRLQIYIPHTGSDIFLRKLTVESTAGSWTYGEWNDIGKNIQRKLLIAGKAFPDIALFFPIHTVGETHKIHECLFYGGSILLAVVAGNDCLVTLVVVDTLGVSKQ